MASEKDRTLVKSAYPSPGWSAKVDKMSDSQVIAVMLRLKQQNKI